MYDGKVLLILVCLACAGHGRRLQVTSGRTEGDQRLQKALHFSPSNHASDEAGGARSDWQRHFMALMPAAAWNRFPGWNHLTRATSAHSEVKPCRSHAAGNSLVELSAQVTNGLHSSPVMSASSEQVSVGELEEEELSEEYEEWDEEDLKAAIGAEAPQSTGTTALDAANRCTLLPTDADRIYILHEPKHGMAENHVLLHVGNGLAVSASPAMALDPRCRRIVNSLGDVTVIRLPGSKSGPVAGAQRAFLAAALRVAYGGARIEDNTIWGDALPADALASHQCEIAFLRPDARQRATSAVASIFGAAQHVPLIGDCLRAATSLGARAARAQLTPTYRPTLTLQLLKRLPWQCQRLGARLWVQAMLQEEIEANGLTSEGSETEGAKRHPMTVVRTLPILSPEECEAAVQEAEEYANTHGWLTDRHVSYPTTDIPIRHLPKLSSLWNTRIFPMVAEAFRSTLGLPNGSTVTPLDVFVVKYDHAAQRELAVHRDNGLLTFSLLLNDPSEFSGGGTYFEADGAVYRPSRGVGVLHSALVRHAGYPIDGGTRYVLVGFCGLSSPRLPEDYKSWRFGDPPWYVSSRVVTDEQILARVWPPAGAAK